MGDRAGQPAHHRGLAGGPAVALLGLLLGACAAGGDRGSPNPPAPGFDRLGSDPRAVAIADAVMQRMGGRRAWDHTRFIAWNFFGHRRLVWDKREGRVRVEGTLRDGGRPYVVVLELDGGGGRAWIEGEEVSDPRRRGEMLEAGRRAWINDSYWLVMPYKLKDTGVTLADVGVRTMEDGRAADVLELTFKDVGVTPENKYDVYVARDSGLVEQWDFYRSAADEKPGFRTPWHGWRRYGDILLSGDRGSDAALTEIAVLEELPASLFASPVPATWPSAEPPGAARMEREGPEAP